MSLWSGIFGVIFTVLSVVFPKKARPILLVLGLIGLLLSPIYAWRDEYRQRREKETLITSLQRTKSKGNNCEFIPMTAANPAIKSNYWTSVKFQRTDAFEFAQRRVDSPRADAPYAYEIMVKTGIELHPVAISLEYKGKIFHPFDIDFKFVEAARAEQHIKRCLRNTQPKSFLLSFQYQWPTDVPMVITIFTKEPLTVTRIKRENFEWTKSSN